MNWIIASIYIPEILYVWYPRTTIFIGFLGLIIPDTSARILGAILFAWSLYIFIRRSM